jgi:hypothetical protein
VNGAGSDASVVTTELRQEDVATAGENTIGVNLVNEGLPIHHSLVGNGPVAGVVGTNEQVAVAEVGTLTFTKMGPGSTVLLGGVQTLLEVEFYAQNEDIEIDKLYVSVNTQGSAASVGQITLENEYGEPLGTGFLNSLNRVEFDPDLTIPEDQNVKVVVKGEILNPFGSVFTVITASGVTGIGGSSGAAVIVPSALFAHHTLTSDTVGEVQVGTITLAKEFGVSEFLAAGGTQDVLKFSIIPQGEHVELHRLNFNFDRNGVTFGSNVRLSNQDYDTVWEGSPTDVMKMDFTFPISMAKGQKHTYTLQADLEGVDTVGDSIATTLSDAVVSGKSSGAMLTSDGLPIMHTRIK